jgi:hypothetical protein
MGKEAQNLVRLTAEERATPPAAGSRAARGPNPGAVGTNAADGRCRWPPLTCPAEHCSV